MRTFRGSAGRPVLYALFPPALCDATTTDATTTGRTEARCRGGWIGPRGVVVNEFHAAASPRHPGLRLVGDACGQSATLEFRVPVATRRSVNDSRGGGYVVWLLFVHSYEHFGNFSTTLEVVAEPSSSSSSPEMPPPRQTTQLSGRWGQHISVPSPEVIGRLGTAMRGKLLRLVITAPASGSASLTASPQNKWQSPACA